MSAALLSRDQLIVGIADELESFLHVLIYYAVRYLEIANCDHLTIANYLHTYFNIYGVYDGTYVCGDKKYNTVTQGKLSLSSGKELEFGSPLDSLFAEILPWFKARYAVLSNDRSQKANMSAPPPVSALRLPALDLGAIVDEDLEAEYPLIQSAIEQSFEAPVAEAKPWPSSEIREDAEKLSTHGAIEVALRRAYFCNGWLAARVQDNIPDWWVPPQRAVRAVRDTSASSNNKRPRIGPPPVDLNLQQLLPTSAIHLRCPVVPPVTPKKLRVVETTWHHTDV